MAPRGISLNHKFTLATVLGFVLSAGVFLGLFLMFYLAELERARILAAGDVSRLLQSSLENAMLKRDLEGLAFIVNRLGAQPSVSEVMITDPLGQVRFSSNDVRLYRILGDSVTEIDSAKATFQQNEQGVEVMRAITPVLNQPQCQQCHGSAEENPVNGILVVDHNATSIRHRVRDTTLTLMGAGALIVVINLVGGWWFIRRFVLGPVESLSAASRSLAHGELDRRVSLKGNDELSLLGDTFNNMADKLRSSFRSLEEGQAFLQGIVDAVPDGLRVIDDDYNMVLVNKAFNEQTGSNRSWIGEKCYRAAYDSDEPCPAELITCPLEEIRKGKKSVKVIHHHHSGEGNELDVEIYAAPMKISTGGKEQTLMVESIRDLTKQVQFTHEQRLSELGQLAAGVAHEIYNPLSTIKIALHALSEEIEKFSYPSEIRDYLAVTSQEMDKCVQITDRLLHLSAAPVGQPELVDLQRAITDVLSLVRWNAMEASVEIEKQFSEDMVRTFASESEMRMLILNLVQNAFHAMPAGGKLRIQTFKEGNEIVILFKDNGVGIHESDVKRIFAPFFSRRADGVQGTGLGLSICRSIAERYGGTLRVRSDFNQGSCFIVRMPEASINGIT